MTAYERVTARLAAVTDYTPRPGGNWRCPSHDDNTASLKVTESEGKVLVFCHAGCDRSRILRGLSMGDTDLFDDELDKKPEIVATYNYTDEEGEVLYQVVRYEPKGFKQRRPNGIDWTWGLGDVRRVLFNLPKVLKAVEDGQRVWLTEGEEDALALERHGVVATTNAGGASKWLPQYTEALRGADVVLCGDRDKPGREHMEVARKALDGVARSISVVEAKAGKDARDHFKAGYTLEDFFDVSGDGLTHVDPPVGEALAQIDRLIESGGQRVTGLPSGFKKLDDVLTGFQPGNLIVIGARPAMGKSGAAIGAATHAALSGRVVLFFSLEMSLLEICKRMLANVGSVEATKLSTGMMNMDERERLNQAAKKLGKTRFYLSDVTMTVDAIQQHARKVQGVVGLDLIVVDYLQLMNGRRGAENRQVEVAEMSRSLKVLAKDLHVPIVALSQLSRNVENREDKRPRLSDLRETGAIENDADVVLLLYRDEIYNPHSGDQGICEVQIAKNRHGRCETVKLAFVDRFVRFADLAYD